MLSALTLVDKTVNSPKNNANLLFVLSKPTVINLCDRWEKLEEENLENIYFYNKF